MAELRRDPIVGRWVIIDTDHPSAPEDFEKEILEGVINSVLIRSHKNNFQQKR